MNSITPKQLFQESQPNNRQDFTTMCKSPAVRNAVVFAFSEMVMRPGVTKEHLEGAKIYADILLNLGEAAEKVEPFPSKQLHHL